MLKLLRTFVLTVSLGMFVGCGTFAARVDGYPYTDYYKATHLDFSLLFNGDSVNKGYVPATLWCWLSVACPVITLYSLPVDIAVDTLLIPYDAYKASP
ncbi:MAG: YceK/YidQ family lipoprotein [Gammaproteobacteria bacterium HGW-Gammaproteobacteria-6]|nr:MAG: YceK/YidQ family lipoprotein [Gammaproteobacteria bacterium HGW-Gammaproteobacteria-6]